MSLVAVPAASVADLVARIDAARNAVAREAAEVPTESEAEAAYWEEVFEEHARRVLAVLPRVRLREGREVRYRFYGKQGGDLLVRPFVASVGADVSHLRRMLAWHPAPDSMSPAERLRPTRDVDLLYGHFELPDTPEAVFEYWMAMEEIWASARWVHSVLITSAEDFSAAVAAPGWTVRDTPQSFTPLVAPEGAQALPAELVVLVRCPLGAERIELWRARIDRDGSIAFRDAVPVATGPRGYTM